MVGAVMAAPTPEAPGLTPLQRKRLRALAHPLEPIVHVGKSGLSDAVVSAALRALLDHELIKVRLHEPEDKRAMAQELAARTEARLCGLLGHTVILYKRHPTHPRVPI